MEVLYIRWYDAGREAFGWTEPSEIDTDVCVVETVGFLFKETDLAYTVVQNKDIGNTPDEVLFCITIPKGCVIEKQTIFYPSAE